MLSRRSILALSSIVATATMAAAPALAADNAAPVAATDLQAATAIPTVAAPTTVALALSVVAAAVVAPTQPGSSAPSSSLSTSSSTIADASSTTAAASNGSTPSTTASGAETSSSTTSSLAPAVGGVSTIAGASSTTTTTSVKTSSTTTTTVKATTTTSIDPTATINKSLFEAPAGGWPIRRIVFPTLGAVSYADGWGDYRGDIATHFHIGVDILGSKLQPLVAVTNGRISHIVQNHVTAGWGLVITDDEGYDYRYYHMNNDTPGTDDGSNPSTWRFAPGIIEGSRVVAGQLIGYMGDSGDSEETTHTHFEIHRPDGTPINPFPSVRAAEKSTRCTPPVGLGDMPSLTPPTDTDAQVVTVEAYSGLGSFTMSANGSVFRVGSARQIGDPRFNQADGACATPGQ